MPPNIIQTGTITLHHNLKSLSHLQPVQTSISISISISIGISEAPAWLHNKCVAATFGQTVSVQVWFQRWPTWGDKAVIHAFIDIICHPSLNFGCQRTCKGAISISCYEEECPFSPACSVFLLFSCLEGTMLNRRCSFSSALFLGIVAWSQYAQFVSQQLFVYATEQIWSNSQISLWHNSPSVCLIFSLWALFRSQPSSWGERPNVSPLGVHQHIKPLCSVWQRAAQQPSSRAAASGLRRFTEISNKVVDSRPARQHDAPDNQNKEMTQTGLFQVWSE